MAEDGGGWTGSATPARARIHNDHPLQPPPPRHEMNTMLGKGVLYRVHVARVRSQTTAELPCE
jgi:hypothetical protein